MSPRLLAKPAPLSTPLSLWAFDVQQLQQQQVEAPWVTHLVGIDEVGRGSWIGPVVVAAVALPGNLQSAIALAGVNDSKKLSAKKREMLYEIIMAEALVAVDWVTLEELMDLNIYQASRLGFQRALHRLLAQHDLCADNVLALVDGNARIPDWPQGQQRSIIKGDGQSAAIAAASIVAKVTRDRWVVQQSERYPWYGWHTNMGYGTQVHQQAVRSHGLTPLHRPSFTLKK
jgi:ribonuclease HII